MQQRGKSRISREILVDYTGFVQQIMLAMAPSSLIVVVLLVVSFLCIAAMGAWLVIYILELFYSYVP